jgi:hypothetical protein
MEDTTQIFNQRIRDATANATVGGNGNGGGKVTRNELKYYLANTVILSTFSFVAAMFLKDAITSTMDQVYPNIAEKRGWQRAALQWTQTIVMLSILLFLAFCIFRIQ